MRLRIMKYVGVMTLLLTISMSVGAQTITGTVHDIETGETLPFVTIGIPGHGLGTVAQADGKFSLRTDGAGDNDTIRISMIGYATEKTTVGAWRKKSQVDVFLSPIATQLDQVTVRPHDYKKVRLGNDYHTMTVQVGFNGGGEDTVEVNPPGAELGTIMKVKDGRKYFLDSCGMNLTAFTPDSAVLRINFYQLQNDEPDMLLNKEPIYVTIYKNQSEVRLDLRKYDIVAEDDFVMAAEWLVDLKGKEEKILFSGGFIGAGIRYRTNSASKWKKVPVGIAMFVDAVYEK
ncbi:MAG TPA: carboxypeptidase-like regulatory domain-containing protein [Chitinophagales bacterium]|nr:carboxypeptidase-like regulatory domain-containing protein [Chitinophagales bacterium]HMX04259.1 carboxypeptidase-like regulatory domain-containing protein [Chitinophagales bacterium]HNE45918.1 carboxypeptidase-like regulatory domain-containing protein [Chitinophagales bacterium]HNI54807.1 carboxypeptidase-like regulatory domain-containing protein [Chitinophagales bacterium]HNJ89859.1 carboxypeptidase-like regulatory domain-containing protein [Chitinophagales bacterium]